VIIPSEARAITEAAMKWFRNLFKSHAQKRIEARQREEAAWRASHRTAGPPVGRDQRQSSSVHPLDKSKVA
jgi:hypothetical protein